MLATRSALVTVRDYLELPEGGPDYQLIGGHLYMSPPPNRYHQDVSRNLQFVLMKYLEKHPIGILYNAPFGVYLSDVDAFLPDLVFVSNKRKRILTDQGAEGAPDLVVEILSKSTARFDKGPKRDVYTRTGVQEYWVVDPVAKEIQVYELQKDAEVPRAIYRADQALESPLFPKLKIRLAKVF